MDCVFCDIVADELPSRTVYRDAQTVAFLDANPLARGHTLVVPTDHYERLESLPAELAGAVFETVHRLIEPIQSGVDAEATTVAVNNGPAAGQEVPHVHCHVVPRHTGDGGGPIHAAMGRRPQVGDDEADDIAERIAAAC